MSREQPKLFGPKVQQRQTTINMIQAVAT